MAQRSQRLNSEAKAFLRLFLGIFQAAVVEGVIVSQPDSCRLELVRKWRGAGRWGRMCWEHPDPAEYQASTQVEPRARCSTGQEETESCCSARNLNTPCPCVGPCRAGVFQEKPWRGHPTHLPFPCGAVTASRISD